MASNLFCKVDGIPGGSTDDKHKDYFEVISFSHGCKQDTAGTVSGVGGFNAGRVSHEPFTVVKSLDKATPKLAFACSKGDPIKEVILECWQQIGDNVKYMQYKLSDCVVRSVYPAGGGDGIPTETISFSYSKIEWLYTQYDNKGKKLGEIPSCWDLEHNKAC